MSEECLICKAPLEYLETDTVMGCAICYQKLKQHLFAYIIPAEVKWQRHLEMVRVATSAVNEQPWRVIACDNAVHFYLKRSKGFSYNKKPDMQMIDIGIALCHFDLTAKENNFNIVFEQNVNTKHLPGNF